MLFFPVALSHLIIWCQEQYVCSSYITLIYYLAKETETTISLQKLQFPLLLCVEERKSFRLGKNQSASDLVSRQLDEFDYFFIVL